MYEPINDIIEINALLLDDNGNIMT